jgi:hypothetical protein
MKACLGLVTAAMSALLAAACANDSGESGLVRDARAFESEAFDTAKAVCGYQGTSAEFRALDEAESDSDRCMFELAVEFSDCTLEAMDANAADGRSLLDCSKRRFGAIVECCRNEEGSCTAESVEQCDDTVTEQDPNLTCRYESIRSTTDACEAGDVGGSSAGSSDGLVVTENADGSFTVETAEGPVVIKAGDAPVVIETPQGVLLEVQVGDDGSFHATHPDAEASDQPSA